MACGLNEFVKIKELQSTVNWVGGCRALKKSKASYFV